MEFLRLDRYDINIFENVNNTFEAIIRDLVMRLRSNLNWDNDYFG